MFKMFGVLSTAIPVFPGLVKRFKSIQVAYIIGKLEYWFGYRDGENFYKFLEPCKHKNYTKKDSWSEEFGISDKVFLKAFARIAIIYNSKTEYDNADDKFQGRPYCSYYNRVTNMTWYCRNHDLMDSIMQNMTNDCSDFIKEVEFPGGNFDDVDEITGNSREVTTGNFPEQEVTFGNLREVTKRNLDIKEASKTNTNKTSKYIINNKHKSLIPLTRARSNSSSEFGEGPLAKKFEEFWKYYYPGRKGSRHQAWERYKTQCLKDPLLADRIFQALVMQKHERFERAKLGLWVPEPCLAETWINQKRWDNEVMTDAEIANEAAMQRESLIRQKIAKTPTVSMGDRIKRSHILDPIGTAEAKALWEEDENGKLR